MGFGAVGGLCCVMGVMDVVEWVGRKGFGWRGVVRRDMVMEWTDAVLCLGTLCCECGVLI